MSQHLQNKKCDIVIVTFNSARDIFACVDSLFQQDRNSIARVIIVDNASTDTTDAVMKKLLIKYPFVNYSRNTENIGFSRANNLGLQRCTEEYIVFLNPDTKIEETVFSRIIETLDKNPHIGIVGPKLLYADGTAQTGYGVKPDVMMIIFDFLLAGKFRSYFAGTKTGGEILNVDWVSGACLAGRHALLKNLHGFDENIFMYSEDVDICLRAQKSGFQTAYDPRVRVYHYAGKSREYNRKQALIANIESRFYYAKKYLRPGSKVILSLFFFLYLFFRSLFHTALFFIPRHRQRSRAYWGAFMKFIIQKGYIIS